MKSRIKMTLTAGAALSLFVLPALAQQNGNPVPQITFPKSASHGSANGGVHVQLPGQSGGSGPAQLGGSGPAQLNGSSGGASGSGTAANTGGGGAGANGGTGTASANASGGNNGALNVGGATTGSINKNGNNAANGVAVRHPITGQQLNQILGMNVLNSKGVQVGSVSNLVVDQKHLAYAVIDVGGGFLGLGDHKIAVPVSKLTLQSNPAVLHTALTQQQLQQLPTYQAKNYTKYQSGNGNGANNGGNGVFGANGGNGAGNNP
ncbi:MAG TPA: PRC-barrel domain-containing protein [Pararhizobium sp.]|nr:PRC-barrel domain-containing protein [Pararhizobium sp.]